MICNRTTNALFDKSGSCQHQYCPLYADKAKYAEKRVTCSFKKREPWGSKKSVKGEEKTQ
jgi:hypothetical protein